MEKIVNGNPVVEEPVVEEPVIEEEPVVEEPVIEEEPVSNLDTAQKWAVEAGIMVDRDWLGSVSKKTLAWILFDLNRNLITMKEDKNIEE